MSEQEQELDVTKIIDDISQVEFQLIFLKGSIEGKACDPNIDSITIDQGEAFGLAAVLNSCAGELRRIQGVLDPPEEYLPPEVHP